MHRRELFSFGSKIFKKDEAQPFVVLPPYLEDVSNLEYCLTCETKECIASCDERILFLDENGKPFVDFLHSGCTYCGVCLEACPHGVLSDINKKIDARFEIDMIGCLAWNQTMCYSCKDKCIDNAISFIGLFRPSIDQQKCTSCGFCAYVCPTGAIRIGEKI